MAFDREMSMDAEIISKFITQQVAVAMAKKSREYEKKIKNLRKVEKIMCPIAPPSASENYRQRARRLLN